MFVSSKNKDNPFSAKCGSRSVRSAVTYWKIRRETRPSVIHRAVAQASPLTKEERIMTPGGEDS
jgi:hypothetical protein